MDPKELLEPRAHCRCVHLLNCEREGTLALMVLVVYYRDNRDVSLVDCCGDARLQCDLPPPTRCKWYMAN